MGEKLTVMQRSSMGRPFSVPLKRGNIVGGHFGTADQLCENGAFGRTAGEGTLPRGPSEATAGIFAQLSGGGFTNLKHKYK